MNVIAKMIVSSITDFGYSREIKFNCQHDQHLNTGDNPENRAFTKATPNGEAKMMIDNKYVWDAFQPVTEHTQEGYNNASHYVIFVPCREHSLEDVHRCLQALDEKPVDDLILDG